MDDPIPHSPGDVSAEAMRLARAIDRTCRLPGRYTITIIIPPHLGTPWSAEITRVESLQQLILKKKSKPNRPP
jgi:hypothetical protein